MKRFIYKTTNLINGKFYIGQHSTENLDDGYMGSGTYLKKSFKKYGKENFKCEIIEEIYGSKNDLDYAEETYIKLFLKAVGKKRMYNVTEHAFGGIKGCTLSEEHKLKISRTLKGRKGIPRTEEVKKKISETLKGRTLSEETKKKLSQSLKGQPAWNKGIPRTEEVKKKISETLKGQPAWNKGIKGHHHSEEVKKKISESLSKKVLCIETNIIYPSLSLAGELTGVDSNYISKVCRGKNKTAGGYHWKFV